MLVLAIILASVILVGRFIDFLLGAKGRRRLKDVVLLKPWIYLGNRPFSALLARGAASFERLSAHLFGPNLFFGNAVLYIALLWAIPFNLTLFDLAPRLVRIEPHPFEIMATLSGHDFYTGYLEEVFWIFSFAAGTAAIASLRRMARRLSVSVRIVEQLRLLLTGFGYLAALAAGLALPGLVWWIRDVPTMEMVVLNQIRFHLIWFNAIVFGMIPAVATLAFVTLLLAPVTLEIARRFATLLLERLDEDNRSPLGVLSAGLAAVIALLTLLVRACSATGD